YYSCRYGNIELAKWLYKINNNNSIGNISLLIKSGHEHNQCLQIVIWLCELSDEIKTLIVNNKLLFDIIKQNTSFWIALINNKLEELYSDIEIQPIEDVCSSCLTDASETENKWIQLTECKHMLCTD